MLKKYYSLTKPGIIYGNLIYATAGFLLASDGHIKLGLLLAVLAGTSLVIAGACVFNNCVDRNIDKRMARTKNRALVQHTIALKNALIYGAVLGMAGFAILAAYTNWLTVLIEAVAFVDYVVVYGWTKRRSVHGTVVGSISGAAPPVAGYCAVSGSFDSGALLLFLILVFWQMPHFYAIAIYRLKDYKAAGIPVLPAVKGVDAAKKQIVLYIAGFMLAAALLTAFGYTGYSYLVVMAAASLAWLRVAVKGFSAKDNEKWARDVFKFSLIVTLVFSFMLSVNTWLP